jgi:hypothetical protein
MRMSAVTLGDQNTYLAAVRGPHEECTNLHSDPAQDRKLKASAAAIASCQEAIKETNGR